MPRLFDFSSLALAILAGSACNGGPEKSAPAPRTVAEVYSTFEKVRTEGRSSEALKLAKELDSAYSGTPEAERAVQAVPALEKAVAAEQEAERVRAAQAAADAEKARLEQKWSYRVDTDPMTSRSARYATIESENTVSFDFPYEGAQRGTLTLREHPRYGRDVIFSIEQGQLLCPSYDGCGVAVRFDEGTASRWSAAGPADNSSTSLFIHGEPRFVQRLRSAKVLRLQVSVFQEGAPVFEFQVGGFNYQRHRGN